MSSSKSLASSALTTADRSPARLSPWLAVRVLLVRLRFFLVLLLVVLLVGFWPTLRQFWLRLGGAGPGEPRGRASDMEFWCPMCPGVISDWPGKCPVCNMALVRRKKGEATPLPNGVLARMQFSPYRVQLAGIQTVAVEYRPLRREVVLVAPVERSTFTAVVGARAEVFATDLPFLTEGQTIEVSSDALSGHAPWRGRIARIEVQGGVAQRSHVIQLDVDDPDHDLRPGMLITARAEAPLARLAWWRRAVTEETGKESAADLALHSLLTPTLPAVPSGASALLKKAYTQSLHSAGYELAVPCSAVIDHGTRKVVFIENMPGMFDAVEITVGPRCGDYHAVLRGVAAGQRVAATGAFLLDAEMWLNHNVAATYFGATRGRGEAAPARPSTPSAPPGSLSAEDRLLAAKQKICPVSEGPLDAMGGPVRVEVAGRVVFICCKHCEKALRQNPAEYLKKLPAK